MVAQATARVICESLERRQLLATYTYVVPPGHTAAYIEAVPLQDGKVQVRLDSPAGEIDHTFENTTGLDLINSGTNNPPGGFLFVDKVWAEDKPTADPLLPNDPFGIKVEGGSGGHLRIELGPHDEAITITESTSTSGTVHVVGQAVGYSRYGSGVNKLTIETDVSGGASFGIGIVTGGNVHLPGISPDTALRINSRGPGDIIRLGGAENAYVDCIIHVTAPSNTIYLEQFAGYEPPHSDAPIRASIDYDPAMGAGLNAGHQLFIGTSGNGMRCSATLKQAPDTSAHTIEAGLILLSNGIGAGQAPAALIVAEPSKVGELQSGVGTETTVEAPLIVEDSTNTSGLLLVDGTVTFTGTSSLSTIDHFDALYFDPPDADGIVDVDSGAEVTALKSSRIPNLMIDVTGTFTMHPREVTVPPPPPSVLTVRTLFIEKDASAPEGLFDLTDNTLIIDYSGASPFAGVRSMIVSAYTAGTWEGLGIGTSLGDATNYGLGYAENNGSPSGVGYTNFDGQPVDNTAVLVKYTYYGDANLGGGVNLQDFNRLASNFGMTSGAVWAQGDFNYDGIVNLSDFNRLAINFGRMGLGPDTLPPEEADLTYEDLEEMLNG